MRPLLPLLCACLLAAADLPVPFAGAANMGLADEVAGDGRGGWSDQGAGNDFRTFDRTRARYGGAPFAVLDPAAHGGRAVITLGSRRFPAGPASAAIALPEPHRAPHLYLLHTSCWNGLPAGTPVGAIELEAADGATRAIPVRAGVEVADWWEPKGLANGTLGALAANGEASVGAYVSRFDTGLDQPIRRIAFRGEPAAEPIWIILAATLSDAAYAPEPADLARRWTAAADARWRPVDLRQVQVKPGSALDFSRLVPAGELRRLAIAADGSLRDGDRPVRLWGASVDLTLLAKGFALGRDLRTAPWPDRAALAAYAEAIRVQGYNLVRLGTHDHLLAAAASEAGGFDPRAVAMIDAFVAELRQRGIRLYVDLMGSVAGYTPGNPWSAPLQALDFKRRIFTDEAVRRNWQEGVRAFLAHRNPHTGLSLAEDPAVVSVLPFNEQDIPFSDLNRLGALPAEWTPAWRAWLERTYREPAALAAAWGATAAAFADQPLPDAAALRTGGARAADLGRFLLDRHRELQAWYAQQVSALGCQAPITQYDCIPSLFYHALRGDPAVGAVAMHAYHAHPSAWAQTGSKISQASACASLAPYLRLMAGTRQFGKPFLVTEYGHVFWNRHRHEEGLMAGAFAAFQGWDAMMAHQLPVGDLAAPAYAWADGGIERAHLREHGLDKAPIKPFWVGPDPVARASQVLTTLAFADGAVAASPHRVEVVVDPAGLFQGDAYTGGIPGVQRDLALVARLGVRVGAPRGDAGVVGIPLAGTARVAATDAAAGMAEGSGDPVRLMALLRDRGVLPADNPSDPRRGLWQTPDGALRWEREALWFQVVTPRLVGACFTRRAAADLGALRVERVTVPGTVAAAALDGRPLADSARILLVYATDALNSGMTFGAEDRITLVAPGTAPVLVEAGALTARLATAHAARLRAWALGFDGARRQELPLAREDGAVRLACDMAALPEPAFFIELAAE